MGRDWFTDQKQGELRVVQREGQWYVEPSDVSGETICLFDSGELSAETDIHTISVRVKNFRRGSGDAPNYLTVQVVEDDASQSANSDSSTTDNQLDSGSGPSESTESMDSNSGYPKKSLTQLRGTGEYVTIEAEIREIEYVKKNTPNMPDMKGILTEKGSIKRVPFVVDEGVKHPYFEAGKRFRFRGAKDHRYTKKNEIQVLITHSTSFTEL